MKNVERYYDQLAGIYDAATSSQASWLAPATIYEMILPRIKFGDRIMDLGFGTGQSLAKFIDLGCDVSGIDISENMVAIGKAKFPQAHLSKADLENGLPDTSTKSFDGVVSVGVLEFVVNIERLFTEVHRILKSDGCFAFSVEVLLDHHELQSQRSSPCGIQILDPNDPANFPVHRYTTSEVTSALEASGLKILTVQQELAYYKTKKMIPIYYNYVLAVPK